MESKRRKNARLLPCYYISSVQKTARITDFKLHSYPPLKYLFIVEFQYG